MTGDKASCFMQTSVSLSVTICELLLLLLPKHGHHIGSCSKLHSLMTDWLAAWLAAWLAG